MPYFFSKRSAKNSKKHHLFSLDTKSVSEHVNTSYVSTSDPAHLYKTSAAERV